MTWKARLVPLVAALATITVLSGCTGSTLPEQVGSLAPTAGPTRSVASTPPAVETPSPAPTASTTPTAEASCGPVSPLPAVQAAAARLPLPAGLSTAQWDVGNADVSGYAPCAALSSVVLGLAYATASSPYAVLLFHDGSYLGTATAVQYPFFPTVTRVASDEIRVTYVFPQGNDSDANPTGRATADFQWSVTQAKVLMTGTTPPLP